MQGTFGRLPRVAFWLVPQRREREALQSIIAALAGRFSAPVFVPHVTVYSCWRTVAQRELSFMAGLAEDCQPVTVSVLGLAGKDRATQALFVDLQNNAAINGLVKSLQAGVLPPAAYVFEPHLSLLYQNLQASVRETLVRETMVHLETIRFDELRAVAIPGQLRVPDDFCGWQTLLICRLDSSSITATIKQ